MGDSSNTRILLLDIFQRLYRYYGPQYWWPSDSPFETIVGAILTQNTNWANASRAIANLKKINALTPAAMRSMAELELARSIQPSGYFNAKAKKLKAMATYLETYGDDPLQWRQWDPKKLRNELLAVYGIGPETADDIVLYVAGLPTFIIDAYTKRIIARLGIAPINDTYEGFQAFFEHYLPQDAELFNEYHALLDRHAKEACLKTTPRCVGCCLQEICMTGSKAARE